MVLLALQVVLLRLLVDAEDAEHLVPEIVLQFVLEIAKVLAMVDVLVVVVIYVPAVLVVVPEVVWMHVIYRALTLALMTVTILVIPIALMDVRIHVVQLAKKRVHLDALVAAQAPALHALDVLVAVLVLELVLDVMVAMTNAPHHVSNPAPDVLVAVLAVHLAAQVVNPLAVILVLELALMAVLIHVEHAVLLVLQIVPQTAEPLAKAHVMEA